MAEITWDGTGEREFETGVDHGVLYVKDGGSYNDGVPWNGLVTVTESPSGAEATPQWADNRKYLNLVSREEFGCTIEAFTYPSEFGVCDGTAEPFPGVRVGQQDRKEFGFCYRTRVGNDQDQNAGYKIHLVWNGLAAPSEKPYSTVNDTPEAITFSWEISTTPEEVTTEVDGKVLNPVASMTINSLDVDSGDLSALLDALYGTAGTDPRLPSPDEVIGLFTGGALTLVDLSSAANSPSYNAATHVITLPAVTGVQWQIDGEDVVAGAQPPLSVGETATVTPTLAAGYALDPDSDDDWVYEY